MARYIQLTRGYRALVDDADFENLNKHQWQPLVKRHTVYAKRGSGNTTVFMHRQILCTPKGMVTDHINNNGLDNRRRNLRVCSNAQNAANAAKHKVVATSRYKGVYWVPDRRQWHARITRGGRATYLGKYDTEQAAARAYDLASIEIDGEFASPNLQRSKREVERIRVRAARSVSAHNDPR